MSSISLLVVEDDPKIAKLLCEVAAEAGFIVQSASGQKAIEAACAAIEPDIITLDILMPDMDGMEVLQFLRARYQRARIVILSGSDGLSRRLAENLGTALGLVIEANLRKPFRMAEIRLILEKAKMAIDVDRKIA